MTEQRKLLETGEVEVTTTTVMPRYEARISTLDFRFYEKEADRFKENYPMTIFHNEYSTLNSFEFGDIDDDETYSLEDYQKALDKAFGENKYKAFILGAYIHGATSFSISEGGDNRCRWDSSNLGFIGIPIEIVKDINSIANELTDIWEGNYFEYGIFDNLENVMVEGILSSKSYREDEYIKELENKYNVNFENVDIEY